MIELGISHNQIEDALVEPERWLVEVLLYELFTFAWLLLKKQVSGKEDCISQQNCVDLFQRSMLRILSNVASFQLPSVLLHEFVRQD